MSTALAALRIGFIGAGRVAQTLAPAFDRAGLNVAAFYNRGPDAARLLGSRVPSALLLTEAQQVVDICDMVFLAVSDDAILPVCRDLRWERRHRVVHCSGATELAALDHAKSAGAVTGGFHPMQMVANPEGATDGLTACTAWSTSELGDNAGEDTPMTRPRAVRRVAGAVSVACALALGTAAVSAA